jgi:uncharacterized phage protein (TIGR01671 family)
MREIKFRAWDKIHKEIKEVAIISWISRFAALWNVRGNVRITIDRDFGDIELMQYTGLKDKNGKEIYEGDIVYAKCCEKYLEVYWNDIGCGGWWFTEKIDGDMYPVGKIDLDWLEVKGNIYENPELLEV